MAPADLSVPIGATTIWERWDGWTEEHGFQAAQMNSFNHYSLGSIGEWMWSSVAGIDQKDDSVAFRDLVITPRLGERLTWVTASFDSPRGLVEVEWRREDGHVGGRLVLPPGRPVEVRVPGREVEDVTLDGRAAGDHPAVERVSAADGTVTLLLQPGSWSVRSSA